jgi:hypothetical protein
VHILVDGMNAANALGLSVVVPAQMAVHTGGGLSPVDLGNFTIQCRLTSASKLYWADRPTMPLVQALYWLRATLAENSDVITTRIKRLFLSSASGLLRDDVRHLVNGIRCVRAIDP